MAVKGETSRLRKDAICSLEEVINVDIVVFPLSPIFHLIKEIFHLSTVAYFVQLSLFDKFFFIKKPSVNLLSISSRVTLNMQMKFKLKLTKHLFQMVT